MLRSERLSDACALPCGSTNVLVYVSVCPYDSSCPFEDPGTQSATSLGLRQLKRSIELNVVGGMVTTLSKGKPVRQQAWRQW